MRSKGRQHKEEQAENKSYKDRTIEADGARIYLGNRRQLCVSVCVWGGGSSWSSSQTQESVGGRVERGSTPHTVLRYKRATMERERSGRSLSSLALPWLPTPDCVCVTVSSGNWEKGAAFTLKE